MAANILGRNIAFKIYNSDGTEFEGLVLTKATFETVVMSLGDKISGDVYYKDNALVVTMSEYITYNGVKYMLVNPPTIVREGMASDNSELRGMTKYSFTFYHPMCLLSNFPFTDVAVTSAQTKYLSQNKTFSWIGNLTDYVDKLNNNLEGTEWVVEIGDTVTSDIYNKLSDVMSFDKVTIADALKTGYETWEVPYVIDAIASTDARYALGKRFLVRFGLPSQEILDANNNPFVFQFGKGVGLKNNSRTPRNNKIVTRIAGYGSENNVPYGYPQIVWTGNQDWDYTINNDSTAANSYPIYDGIVNGQRVRLIKHPFTRTHLMPSVYSDTVNKKVNPNATGYDPTIEIKDYYDAISSQEYTYHNPINPLAPSYEIHEFEDIKPELGQASIVGISAYDLEHADAISIDDCQELLLGFYSESHNETEKIQLNRLIFNLPTATELSGHSDAASYYYDWSLKSDEYYAYIKYTSSILNFSYIVLRAAQAPEPVWDDTMDDDGNYKQSYFKVTLPTLSFDLYACAAITEEMQVNMRSGACIGCTFPIMVDWDDYKKNFYDADGNFDPVIGEGHPRNGDKYPDSSSGQITVVVQKDNQTFGVLMPNIYQKPASGDQFVILGISLPLSYVTAAETRLDDAMIDYMRSNNVYYFDYPLKFDEHFLATHTNILSQMKTNTIVRFNYAGTTMALYIKQMAVKFGVAPLPQYDITLTDDVEVVLNPVNKVADEVSRLSVVLNQGQSIDLEMLYAKFDERYDQRYISKVNDDTAYGLVRLIRGLQVGERFVTGLLGEGGVFREEADGTTYLECDKLYVRMKAYFDTVEIRKFIHSGGNRIASLAGIKCSRVEYIDANGDATDDATDAVKFRCYFRADDNGETVTNDFVVGDLAFCKETNAQVGSGVEQHGYWRAVVGKNSTLTDDGEGWIDLSASDCLTGSDIPIAQDDIIQLGNKNDTTRQGAIVEYVGGADAPSYQIYQGINTYSLENKNYVSMGYNSSTARAYLNVYGDFRFGAKTDSGSYISYNEQAGVLNVKAVINAQSTIGNQSITDYIRANQNNYDDSWIEPALQDIQDQIDGELDTWYYQGVPTLNNLPASTWTTDDDKKKHIGDLYYDKDTGYVYRFLYDEENETYYWTQIHDDAISEALRIANEAQDTADNKRRVFLQQPVPPYDAGDLWVNANYTDPSTQQVVYSNDMLKCITGKTDGQSFSINDWTKASKYTDDSNLLTFLDGYQGTLTQVQNQIDKKAETWYQNSDPSTAWTTAALQAEHVGDLWYCTADITGTNYKKDTTWCYVDKGSGASPRYVWEQQNVPQEVFDKIDGKADIFVEKPTKYNENDMWIIESTLSDADMPTGVVRGDIVIATQSSTSYNKAHWAKRDRYTDDTKFNNYITQVLNGTTGQTDAQIVAQALHAIKVALNENTTVDGGLVLTNLIQMRQNNTIWAGLSGQYSTTALGNGIAAWYGGIGLDYETLTDAQKQQGWSALRWAKSIDRFDGSGYRANGNITWNANGAVTIKNITTLSDSQNTNLLNELATFNNAFTFTTSGQGSTTVLSITPQVPFTTLSILESNVAHPVATQYWVNNNVSGNFWGKSWTNGASISGTLASVLHIQMTGHLYMHYNSAGIYLNSDGTGIDWHDASNNYVATLLAFSSSLITCQQQLYIPSSKSLRIGGGLLVWDADNNAIKVLSSDGTSAANFYATGSVSALGSSGSSGGGGSSTLAGLTDVDITSPSQNQVLVYDNGKWVNANAQSGGTDMATVWANLAGATNEQINVSHLTTALNGYATTSQLAGYVTLSTAQTISGLKTLTHGLLVQGRIYNSGDDEGILIKPASNNMAGITLGIGNLDAHCTLYFQGTSAENYTSFWRFKTGSPLANYDIYHPKKGGVIALVSDIPTDNSQLTNGAGYITSSGMSAYAQSLKYRSRAASTSDIDSMHYAGELNAFTFNGFNIPILAGHGIIIDVGWENVSYGAQLVIDDDPTYIFGLRQRNGSGWSDWKRIPMGDGTGASGTWDISISGNAATATSATTATNLANNPSLQAGTTNTNAVTVTAGGKTSSEFTIPYATRAIKFYSGDSHTAAGCIGSEIGAFIYRYVDISDTSTAPTGGDGFILGINWAGNNRYGAQLYIDTDPTYNISLRQRNANGEWQTWKAIITENNIGSQSVSYATSAGNADTLDGYHASYGSATPFGTIPVIHANGWIDLGFQIEFHYDNTTASDYSTILKCAGNHRNVVSLPSGSGTLALTSQFNDYVTLATEQTISGAKTMTSILTVKAPIFGYNYIAAGVNAAAFILDKPGSHLSGIGAHTSNDVIWFGACGTTGAWIDSYKQIWDFNGTIRQEGNNVIHAGNIGDQTVAAAGKLTTARTIWGKSFDGTADIAGTIYLNEDLPHYFRQPTNASWRGGIFWGSSGFECMAFVAKDTRTSFMFVNGSDIANWVSNTYTTITSPLLYIGSNVGVGTNAPSYKLDVNGTIRANGNVISNTSGGAIEGFHSWELNTHNTAGTNIGGFLDFHYNGTSYDYSTRIIEDEANIISLIGKSTANGNNTRACLRVGANYSGTSYDGSYVQIGAIRIVYNSDTNALRVVKYDGNAANFYATGSVSSLGYSDAAGNIGTFNTNILAYYTGTYDIGAAGSGKFRNIYLCGGSDGSKGFSIITNYSGYSYIGSSQKLLFGCNVDFDDWIYVENRMMIGGNNSNYDLYVWGEHDGNAYFGDNVSVGSLTNRSDMRLKDLVGDVSLSIQQIASAPTFKFRFKNNGKRIMVGTSAQYWDAVLPESITQDADGMLGLDYGVTALVSAIILAKGMTEHERRIAKLEAENKELRARILDLEEKAA